MPRDRAGGTVVGDATDWPFFHARQAVARVSMTAVRSLPPRGAPMSFRAIEPLEVRVLFSTLPANFTETTVASLNTSTSAAMAFAPDGRLFVGDTTHGQIRVIKNGSLLATEALNLAVDHYRERG